MDAEQTMTAQVQRAELAAVVATVEAVARADHEGKAKDVVIAAVRAEQKRRHP